MTGKTYFEAFLFSSHRKKEETKATKFNSFSDRIAVGQPSNRSDIQSNGLAEKGVHIVKNLLRKGCNLYEGLMEYRNTPISNFPYSNNQMLFSQQVRSKVPVHPMVLIPQICHDVPLLLEQHQAKYEGFDDRGSNQLPQLKKGDSVILRKPGDRLLSPAVVIRQVVHDY